MKGGPSPHDVYFKLLTASLDVAADIIRPLLDPALAAAVDWSTLEPAPNEIAQRDGKSHRADLVFRARLKGSEAYILVLVEHQSTADVMMPWRVLLYMVGIWRGWLAVHPGAVSLPPIVPVVIYNGRQPWRAPVDFTALFADVPAALVAVLRPHLPSFRLLVDDLAAKGDEQIEADHRLALAVVGLMALKHGHGDQPDEAYIRLARHIPAALAHPQGRALLETTAEYLYRGERVVPDIDAIARRVNPQAEEVIVGFFDRVRVESREEGRAEGRAEGQHEALVEVLVEALTRRFGELPPGAVSRVEGATASELRYWFSRHFVVDGLDDVFAPLEGQAGTPRG